MPATIHPFGSIVPAVQRIAMISVHTSPFDQPGSGSIGGMNVYVRELSRNLAERGVQVDVFTRRVNTGTPTISSPEPGVRLIQVDAGPPEPIDKDALFCVLPDFASEMAYFAASEAVEYDVIHCHYWLSGWVGHLLQAYWDAPVVLMFHTMAHLKNEVIGPEHHEPALRLQMERRLVGLVDAIVSANPDERMELIRRLDADPDRINLLPPGIDLDRFQPGNSLAARRALNLPDGPLVLFVGRIDPMKGIDTLFEGFDRLVASGSWNGTPPRLVFLGGLIQLNDRGATMDADLQQLAARANALGIGDLVLFRGSQPHHLLPLYYNAADVCAVPSRYESFGLVAVEAMACGTPIVASEVGGLRFTIENEVSGLLVPHSDPVALGAAMRRVLTDNALRSRMQVGARQAAVRYSWQTITSAMQRLYGELVSQRALLPELGDSLEASLGD